MFTCTIRVLHTSCFKKKKDLKWSWQELYELLNSSLWIWVTLLSLSSLKENLLFHTGCTLKKKFTKRLALAILMPTSFSCRKPFWTLLCLLPSFFDYLGQVAQLPFHISLKKPRSIICMTERLIFCIHSRLLMLQKRKSFTHLVQQHFLSSTWNQEWPTRGGQQS